jgi:ComF family protein
LNGMIGLKEIKDSFLHFLYPKICSGCGSDLLNEETVLCMHCIADLPETKFEHHGGNPVEKLFRGRLQLAHATAQYYFTKESLMQRLMHLFKYKGNKELGIQLGRMMGNSLRESGRFNIDALIPLPLFPEKERRRGYNQATLLCEGIRESMHVPVLSHVVSRPQHTESQTRKGRIERWKNIEGKFELVDAASICNKHLLLIDDVITTGATLEACGAVLLSAGNVQLSLATLCIASR